MNRLEARISLAGSLLGFAAGGFFDGIVLHQILQWHHLLSGVAGGSGGDLRLQLLADGLFHAVMYVIALAGLGLLIAGQGPLAHAAPRRRLCANFLVAFGLWHVVDAVLSHWLLGIHRIRMDVDNPLAWDVGWLAIFGLVPVVAGSWLRRGRPPAGPSSEGTGTAFSLLIGSALVLAAAVSARPLQGASGATVAVVLRPDVAPRRLMQALEWTDTRIVWSDARGSVWVLRPDPRFSAWALFHRGGALYVSGALLPAGCAAWLRTAPARGS